MAKWLSSSVRDAKAALERLSQAHAFVLQENGELWRAAPFSAVPTAFRVKNRTEIMVWQLHLGRAWYSCDAA